MMLDGTLCAGCGVFDENMEPGAGFPQLCDDCLADPETARAWGREPLLPGVGTLWKHHSGRIYRVMLIANGFTEHPDRYPITVIYEGVVNKRIWAKSLERFYKTMKPEEE